MSVFETLNSINVNDKTEKKGQLTYLSWAWAWGEVKKAFPDATYTIYERETDIGPVFYFTDGMTCWVKTGLTINGLEHIEMLPVMDYGNKSIPLGKVTSTDVNKAIQRSLTKAAARHGLGLYIYAGEDLPECEQIEDKPPELPPMPEKREPIKGKADTMPEAPAIPDPQVIAFLNSNAKAITELFGFVDDGFTKKQMEKWRVALAAGGIIPDVKCASMTIEQAEKFIDAIYANYRPSGEKK